MIKLIAQQHKYYKHKFPCQKVQHTTNFSNTNRANVKCELSLTLYLHNVHVGIIMQTGSFSQQQKIQNIHVFTEPETNWSHKNNVYNFNNDKKTEDKKPRDCADVTRPHIRLNCHPNRQKTIHVHLPNIFIHLACIEVKKNNSGGARQNG